MKSNGIYITGDIHGEFLPLMFIINQREKLKNCSVIVAGDIGMGFYKPGYYLDTFKDMEKRLSKNNIQLYLVRGNHDNPFYFNVTPDNLKNFPHVHLVHDYEVLHIDNHNILCVGGASSVDKIYRIAGETWWEGENIIPYDKLVCKNIDVVITHCAPMFCPPKYERISWMDDELDEKSRADRVLLGKLYFDLLKKSKPKYWFYGHYHAHYVSELSNKEKSFSDIDKSLLLGGHTIVSIDPDELVEDKNTCKFIGLDMLIYNSWDKYKLE